MGKEGRHHGVLNGASLASHEDDHFYLVYYSKTNFILVLLITSLVEPRWLSERILNLALVLYEFT